MSSTAKTTTGATGSRKGAKAAVERWDKDGGREDQDYYHIPGSPKQDHKEVHARTRGGKSRKS